MEFEEKRNFYISNFNIGGFNLSFNDRCKLIGLICFTYKKLVKNNPSATYIQLINSIDKENILPKFMHEALAIICEDFGYFCEDIPLFDTQPKEIISTIKEMLKKWLPFEHYLTINYLNYIKNVL